MKGNITRRGRSSWRLKLETGPRDALDRRKITYITIRGTRAKAQAELARLVVTAADEETLVEPSKAMIADYMRPWLDTAATLKLSAKIAERYRQLIELQIIPHLGSIPLQKFKPVHVAAWHATLLKTGGHDGGPLSAQTITHAHRVLGKALADAVRHELLMRNRAAVVSPPKVEAAEMQILGADQVQTVLAALHETSIYPHVVLLLSTGMRRGKLAGLQWRDLDLHKGKLRIEKTKAHGLRIKEPKTKHGRRTITLPVSAVEVLKQHRKAQLELRLTLGLGKLPADAFVFGKVEAGVRDPDRLAQDWKRFTTARGLPRVRLHSLRHSSASALIAAGTDPVTVSRRLAHASVNTTMGIYAHAFDRNDEAAAKAIDALIKAAD